MESDVGDGSLDSKSLLKQILGTHAPDGQEFDMGPLLYHVEDILNRATLNPDGLITTGTQAHIESLEERTHVIVDAQSFTIDRISSELNGSLPILFLEAFPKVPLSSILSKSKVISHKALSGTDAHQTTLSILNMISYYAWDAKLVLTLAAFALRYGEFWLLGQIYSTYQLAKSNGIIEHATAMKPRFDELNDLIKVTLEVTRSVFEFKQLPVPKYITLDVPVLSSAMAKIPTAVYWTIKSIVACTTQITNFTSKGYDFAISTTEAHWEYLSTLAHKLKNMRDNFKQQLETCRQYIEEKRDIEYFQMLVNLFENMINDIDIVKVLKALIYPRDDLQPLVEGSTKKRVNIDVLTRKHVLLLISSLDISQDELSILEWIYNESRFNLSRLESQFELVWIPVVDYSIQWTDPMQKHFENLQSSMPWYTVHHPSLIRKPVVRFIKEKWRLRNKQPILVVLDSQGKVVSPNAIHMMWIWGSNAFPFTSFREEALWMEETWGLELLVNGIDPTMLNWIIQGKYIFLFGGDDIEWIRKFTGSAHAVALAARIPLEMIYVGKSSKVEQIRQVIATIMVEKLSSSWQDLAMMWFFWTRLESMLFSKIQLGKADIHANPVTLGIKTLLSYAKEGGWAMLSKGSSIVVNGHANTVLTTLLEYQRWKENVSLQGFDIAFKNHYDLRHGKKYPCCRFEFSHSTGRIPERMKCPECNHNMEDYTTFLCCHEKGVGSILDD